MKKKPLDLKKIFPKKPAPYTEEDIATARALHENKHYAIFHRMVNGLKMEVIKCLDCGKTSYHPKDRENKYCGHCNKFHEI